MKREFLRSLFFVLTCVSVSAFGQKTWDGGGDGVNWNSANNWNPNGVPTNAQTVTIGDNINLTINTAAVCSTFTISSGGNPNNITISGSNSLTVGTTVTIGAGSGANDHKLINVGSGTLSCGSISVAATGGANRNSGITISTGTATVSGSITMNDVNDVVTFSGAGTLNIGNTMTGGTLTPSSGTVNYNNNGAQTVGTYTYNNLTLSGTGTKTTTSVTVNGIYSLAGTTAAPSTAVIYGAAATLKYDKSAPFTATTTEWITPFVATGGVIISNTGQITTPGVLQMGNNTNVPLTIESGASLLASNVITLHGNFIRVGTFTSSAGITIGGTTATQSIDGFTTSGNVILSKPSGVATFQGNVNGGTLSISSTTPFTGTLNLGAALTHTFGGTWTRTAGTLNGGSSTLKIGGNISGTGGTFTAGTGTVEWNASGNQNIASGATITYNNLILSGSGNKVFSGATTISGNLSITGAVADLGTFTHGANSLTLGGTGQLAGSYGSTSSTATYQNNTYFASTGRVNVTTCTAPSTGTATIYYSRNATAGIGAGGNWDDNTSWTTNADGTGGPLAAGVWPRPYDNVVIKSGHIITVNAITDNNYCGISPDGLGNPNIGAGGGTGFNGSNLTMFYQTGVLFISGRLNVISGVNMMVAGYTYITSTGIFSLNSYLVNAGYLEADASSTLTTLDDLSLTGNSTTIINTNSTSADDLNIDHTSATLCGTGTSGLLNSGGSAINYTNSATVAQICKSFTVVCAGCPGFPVVGTTAVIIGNVGPGGVGNSTENKLWLKADNLSQANNTAVTNWTDASGNGLNALANTPLTVANQPTFLTNSVNTILPSIRFDGGDWLNLGTPAALNLIPQTDNWSTFFAINVNTGGSGTLLSKATATLTTRQYQYTIDSNTGIANRFAAFMGGSFSNSGAVATGAWTIATGLTTASATGYNTFLNETADMVGEGVGTATIPSTDVLVGARREDAATTTSGFNLTGNIGEIILYNSAVNTAQRIIIDNYLSAKYGTTLAANDVYQMDNVGNGNYDFEVAGIGQAADGTGHLNAKGTGMVRMWNANALGTNEFLMWGRDNSSGVTSTTAVGTAVDGTIIKERLVRIWRVSESGGDVGTVSVSFNLSSLGGTPLGSNLRLLIDRNGNGFADNDVAPVAGSSSGSIIVFSGINFQNGDRFTLGNTDLTNPLPIELMTFKANVQNQSVVLNWSTASELNNDYFTVERTTDLEKFEKVATVNGKGTTKLKNNYTVTDEVPRLGISYYRLKQTDFDGKFTYSELRKVEVTDIKTQFKIYPNPTVDHKFNFELTGVEPGMEVPLKILSSIGVAVFESTYTADQNGLIKATIDVDTISTGVYIVHINGATVLSKRILIR